MPAARVAPNRLQLGLCPTSPALSHSAILTALPSPCTPLSTVQNGYTLTELVALSGAHTIGVRAPPPGTGPAPVPLTPTPTVFNTGEAALFI